MARLAILGGKPVFPKSHKWPRWPVATKADERRLLQVLGSGQWGLGSPLIETFARRFAESVDARYALPVTTGTAALELAVKALGIGPGDEVIIPAYTFVATATCVLEMGATVVFADIHPETLEMDPGEVEQLITPRTRAVIPVHFGGNPCDMARLKKIVQGKDIALIEDDAHAHGMIYRGKPAGTIGRCGCFSFQSSKNMTAGEGGILVTNDEELYKRAWSLHSFGRLPGREWYEHYVLSWNYRMTGFQAAVLLGQLERLEAQTQRRMENGTFLNQALAQVPGQHPQRDGDTRKTTRRTFHICIWRCDLQELGVSKRTFIEALVAEGVNAFGGYPVPLQENAMFQQRRFWHSHRWGGGPPQEGEPDYVRVRTPVTKAVCGDSVWITQVDLLGTRRDMQGIVDAVAKVVEGADELRAHERRRAESASRHIGTRRGWPGR